ncbi:MAG TPA: ATP-dependent 6-phosphofructokinase [Gemmatimonadaceae bacterium]|jgi:phosphofructokinase-like protein|nr:ATP-dependent 6-phosphofructokinase [Gemmatimonadaceae bacterium]
MRIGLLTGGGDAPGLNAVIRAAVLAAINRGWDVLGIRHGFNGLLDGEVEPLTRESVRGIGHMGGTILRTTNRGDPFRLRTTLPDGSVTEEDKSDLLLSNAEKYGVDAIIAIGGDGTLTIAKQLGDKGMKIVAVPKTIDNDVCCTITTFGFDTAVNTAIEAIDKLHTTAESHDRVLVIEVMGRDAGFIALHSGVAASADVVLIPEIPYDIEKVCEKIQDRDRSGRFFSIVVVAEGAIARGEMRETDRGKYHISAAEFLATEIHERTGKECRSLVLGHLQRGGTPTGYDRLLATRFGAAAVRAVENEKWGEMVALQSPHIVTVPITEVLRELKRVDPKHDIVQTAREMGISMGD